MHAERGGRSQDCRDCEVQVGWFDAVWVGLEVQVNWHAKVTLRLTGSRKKEVRRPLSAGPVNLHWGRRGAVEA